MRAAELGRAASLLRVRIAGGPVASVPLAEDWFEVSVSVAHVPSRTRFVCELHAAPAEADDLGFDDYRFAVKDRDFVR